MTGTDAKSSCWSGNPVRMRAANDRPNKMYGKIFEKKKRPTTTKRNDVGKKNRDERLERHPNSVKEQNSKREIDEKKMTDLVLMRYCAKATDSAVPVMVMVLSELLSRSSQLEMRIMAPLICL